MIHAIKHPEQVPARATTRLAQRLDLSDEQRAEVEQILRRRLQLLTAIRRQLRPQIDGQLDGLREDIAEVLNDDQ